MLSDRYHSEALSSKFKHPGADDGIGLLNLPPAPRRPNLHRSPNPRAYTLFDNVTL